MPDDLDPEIEHDDVPATQTLVINNGSRHPLIARSILQAKDFSQLLANKEKQEKVADIAWEVMSSLLAIDRIVRELRESIEAKRVEIEEKLERYIVGSSPPPPPIVEGLEIDFRSAVLIANHTLNSISELFPVFFAPKLSEAPSIELYVGPPKPLAKMTSSCKCSMEIIAGSIFGEK